MKAASVVRVNLPLIIEIVGDAQLRVDDGIGTGSGILAAERAHVPAKVI